MSRVKGGYVTRRRRKKILKAASGYYGRKKNTYVAAKEQVLHSWSYAYRDRRNKKRDFRRLWIARINAAARQLGVRYSALIHLLNQAGIELDRKVLAEIALKQPETFKAIVESAQGGARAKAA